jgi:hypothetical protein
VVQLESESEPEEAPQKRTRPSRASNGRATRSKAGKTAIPSSGRGARAAKLQANKKLDAQAKELAEFKRQAAAAEMTSPRSLRRTRNNQPALETRRAPLGTRTSARLRGTSTDEDEEWQQVPDEWLHETVDARPTRSTRSSPRKNRAPPKRIQASPSDENDEEDDAEENPKDNLHTGLSSDDAISELTELSDDDTPPKEQAIVKSENDVPTSAAPQPLADNLSPKNEKAGAGPDSLDIDTINHIPPDFLEWEAVSRPSLSLVSFY